MHAKQVVFEAERHVRVDEMELSRPSAGEVLIEAAWSMISPGTELAFLRALPGTGGHFPQYPGYSLAGRITAVGDGVEGFTVGQRVVAQMSHQSAGVVAADLCAAVPEGATLRQAAMYRIGTIALGGVRKGQVQLGHSVLVVGLGLVGNLAAQMARAAGATCVVGVDPVAWRREIAATCGITHLAGSCAEAQSLPLPAHVLKDGFDTVIEATGVPAVFNDAVKPAKRRGLMVLLGSNRGTTEQVDFYGDVHRKGVTLIGAHDSVRPAGLDVPFWYSLASDTRTVLELMAGGQIQVDPLISGDVPGSRASEAYGRLLEADEQLMTLALRW